MSLLSGFEKLLGQAGQAVGNTVHGAEQAVGNFVHPQAPQPVQRPQQMQQPMGGSTISAKVGYPQPPGAYQTQTPIPSFMGQQYLQQINSGGTPRVDPAAFGYGADGGYTSNVPNGPWASGSPIPSFIGQQYANNPQDPQFRGVDPKIFGYGPDNGQYR